MCRSRLSNARVISLLRRAEAANLLIATSTQPAHTSERRTVTALTERI